MLCGSSLRPLLKLQVAPPPLRRNVLAGSMLRIALFVVTSTLCPLGSARSPAEDVVAEFINPNNINEDMPFEKMVIDPSTGRLYVGGVNNLYDLHASSLNVKAHAVTGPEEDSFECPNKPSCLSSSVRKTPFNSYTKGLAVYEKSSKLIECSSLFQGRCRWRNLYNIDQKDVIKESQQHVVANDRYSSTVIFIGSGAPVDGVPSDVLYVASTYVQNGGPFRDDVPAVASLSLDQNRLFDVSVQGVGTGTEIKMERRFRGQYRIEYVGGFQSGKFAYFATRQPKGDNTQGPWPVISKLVRVCTGDVHFWSYTEVPIECSREGEVYNLVMDVYLSKPGYDLALSLGVSVEDDVLYAVFVKGTGPEESKPDVKSALCVYSMAAVEKVFLENIEMCFKGETYKNLPWFKSTDRCLQTKFSGQEVLCGKDVNSYIGGEIPIEAQAVVVTKDAQFTAVATNTTRANTVAFIGTHDGRLLKAVIENRTSAFVYRTLEVGGGKPVLQDLELDGTGDYIYVLSPNSVSKVKVRRCGGAVDCQSCLAQRDPYCGWCVLNNGCVPEGDCTKSIPSTPHDWLTFRNGKCPAIRSVEPDKMQITSASYLNIELENLPNLGTQLTCIFDFGNASSPLTMVAEQTSGADARVRCPTPSLTRLPKIPAGFQSLPARLAISGSVDGPPVAFTNFTFYDCSRFISCGSCVSSSFPCDWCVESNQCVAGATTENRCRAQHIINGVARNGPSRRKGPSFCPHMVAAERDIYVAAGKSKQLSVQVKNIMDFMSDFKCQFKIEHSVHERLARKHGDQIICEDMKFDYYGPGVGNGTAEANFSVVWSSEGQQGGHVLDNIQGIRVIIYKCEMLANNCGLCLALSDKKFDCGWCPAEKQCTRQERCPAFAAADWLDRSQLCPNPVIIDFNPKKGPIAGGTMITIDGVNLGHSYQDVAAAVMAANVRCDVDERKYVTASRIVCRTRSSSPHKMARNPIVVKLREDLKYTAISNQSFTYVDPLVTRMEPLKGTVLGGTDVTITGENLDAGSVVNVSINNIVCKVLERHSEKLVCRTGPSSSDAEGSLRISFDGFSRDYDNFRFKYEKKPRFVSVRPERSIASGGIVVDVYGTGFKLVQRPHMVVMDEDRAVKGPICEIERDDLMHCKTPDLQIPDDRRNHPTIDHPLKLEYGFELDGVRPGNTSHQNGFDRLSVFPDPIIEKFNDVRFHRPDDYLTINGKYLDAAASERDVWVTVGGATCNLTALANRALTCQPPPERPIQLGAARDADPEVVVRIGGISYNVGQLSYDDKGSGFLPQSLIAIFIATIAFILALLLLAAIFYRRKSTSHMREMRHLRSQIDQIEMKVATECKEAFAELQTSMNALAADLPLGTPFIPFLSYKEYTARVLFPSSYHNHPVLRDLEVDSQRAQSIEMGLRAFNKLLMNKHFLLSFVRAMENNTYFLAKDRVSVGSLLMVVLLEKMEYCTEILKQLLKELIDRTVEKKFQPKILFRRSESVAERMLAAWYTFLMHRYLTECAGQKLYELYWAIKQQTEKGPQDAITLEARYSLSEEKLLRSSFDVRELTVFVVSDHHGGGAMEYPVRVLDCDTITQVKEKCLDAKCRTVAFSERPSANDLDLELRSPGRIILQDIDSTSKVEPGGWKRINTLAHYKVVNNATLALLPRQASLYNLSLLSERSERSTFSLSKQSPTLARPFGTNSSSQSKGLLSNSDSNYKFYHLVKPSEHGPSEQQDKMVTEIYLTRLLTMKGTLQKFIQELLLVIFPNVKHNLPSTFPCCIKYMFDFMDDQAREHGIDDDEVVHAWKSNSLPLRFWVNLIKNPHFVFDIQKPSKIEGCLSVVAQTLMDACSTQDQQLTKDSPSSKLLFAKDIYQYREWVDRYYAEIRAMPSISDQDMNAFLAEESRSHSRDKFHIFSALNELYKYLEQYKDSVREELEMNQFAVNQKLPQKFQEMLNTMECMGEQYCNGGTGTIGGGYGHHNPYRRPREDRV